VNLPSRLLRLSEGGEPALTHGPEPGSTDARAFSRLVELGVLERQDYLTAWDPCDSCDCGAEERLIRWDGNQPFAVCPMDAGQDTALLRSEIERYQMRPAQLAAQISKAAGLDHLPDMVVPGLWLIGRVTGDRTLVVAMSTAVLRHQATLDRLRAVDRATRYTLIGHVSSATEIAALGERGVDVVSPDDAFMPSLPQMPIRLDRSKLIPSSAMTPRLSVDRTSWRFELDGRVLHLTDQTSRLLHALAETARRHSGFLSQADVQAAVYGALQPPDSRQLRDVARDLRDQMAQGLAGEEASAVRLLIQNQRVERYRLALAPEEIAIMG
jgi:DNA-binding response OmpR family regulator